MPSPLVSLGLVDRDDCLLHTDQIPTLDLINQPLVFTPHPFNPDHFVLTVSYHRPHDSLTLIQEKWSLANAGANQFQITNDQHGNPIALHRGDQTWHLDYENHADGPEFDALYDLIWQIHDQLPEVTHHHG